MSDPDSARDLVRAHTHPYPEPEAVHHWSVDVMPRLTDRPGAERHVLEGRDGNPLDALVIRRDSASLVVCLHGSLDRARYQLPRFERRRSLEDIDTNLLFLADPTLHTSDTLRIGWYIGTEQVDATDRCAAMIRHTAAAVGAEQIIIQGASAGGFAALALAARLPDALAIVFSPQTNAGRFGESWAREFTAAAFPSYPDYPAVESAHPTRVDLATLWAKTGAGRAWYVQNTGDATHVTNHLQPFQKAVGDRIDVHLEFHAEGHAAPTPTTVRRWVERGLNAA